MLEDAGFTEVVTGEPVDTFGGAEGEHQARAFEVYGYVFMARRPEVGSAELDGLAQAAISSGLDTKTV